MSRLARLQLGIRRGCIARCVSIAAADRHTVQTIRDLFSRHAKVETAHVNEAVPATTSPQSVPVAVIGWVRSARKQKNVTFLELSDGTSPRTLQVIWSAADNDAVAGGDLSMMDRLTVGASVRVEGGLVPSPKPAQPIELHASLVRVLGDCPVEPFPLQKKAHSQEFLRDVMHLRPRTAGVGSMLRLRSALSLALHNFFAGEGYVHVATPILTSNDCEGAGEQFAVSVPRSPAGPAGGPMAADQGAAQLPRGDSGAAATRPLTATPASAAPAASASPHFFGKPVYLTVSGQLHLEAYACALSRVYTFGPTFRAENSNTSRHLSEFWMLEPELAPGSMDDAIGLAERCVRAGLHALVHGTGTHLHGDLRHHFAAKGSDRECEARVRSVLDAPAGFARMSYGDAVEVLQAAVAAGKAKFKQRVSWEGGLASEHERYLAETHVGGPLFVTDYPAAQKAFYMRANDADGGRTVAAFDLLVPGVGELIGGSAREERWDVLALKMAGLGLLSPAFTSAVRGTGGSVAAAGAAAGSAAPCGTDAASLAVAAAAARSLPPADCDGAHLDWYLDLRRFGSLPHAGWGMGFERLVLFATGIDNIRDAIPAPRVPASCRM